MYRQHVADNPNRSMDELIAQGREVVRSVCHAEVLDGSALSQHEALELGELLADDPNLMYVTLRVFTGVVHALAGSIALEMGRQQGTAEYEDVCRRVIDVAIDELHVSGEPRDPQ